MTPIRKRFLLMPAMMTIVGLLSVSVFICAEKPSSDMKQRGNSVQYRSDESSVAVTETERIFLVQMYTELLSFKDTREFHSHGFAEDGPFCSWRIDLEIWMEGSITPGAMSVVEDLIALGDLYIRSYGVDNLDTRYHRDTIEGILQYGSE